MVKKTEETAEISVQPLKRASVTLRIIGTSKRGSRIVTPFFLRERAMAASDSDRLA